MPSSASPSYIGRFAPTPSGHLHFGSLIAALASYLDARAVGGRWLLRMEDLDPPREMPGAQAAIAESLQRYGFEWDGAMQRQSDRHDVYDELIDPLGRAGRAQPGVCPRTQPEAHPGAYRGVCRDADHPKQDPAVRLRVPNLEYGHTVRVEREYRQHVGR